MDYFILLPDEIIIDHIFIYLKASPYKEESKTQKGLKNLTLVCKRFNKIIGSSKALISNFELIISNTTLDNGLFDPPFIRKYRRLFIIDSNINQQKELFKVFERYGENLEILSLNGKLVIIYGRSLFQHTPKLQTVIVSCFISMKQYSTQKCKLTDLPNLKNIFAMGSSSSSVLNVFSNCVVENLSIGSIENFSYSNNIAWKLKKLTVQSTPHNTFLKFLNAQNQYLEYLDIYIENTEFLKFIMNFLNIRTLKLHFVKNVMMPKNILGPNANLKHLVIEHENRHTSKQLILQILSHYPCLETIKYDGYCTGVCVNVNDKIRLLDLHSLDVTLPDSVIILNCIMPKLQKLTIKTQRSSEEIYNYPIFDSLEDLTFISGPYLQNMIFRFPNVKSLTLNHVTLKKKEFVDLINNLPQLRKIQLFKPKWDKKGKIKEILNVLNNNVQVKYI